MNISLLDDLHLEFEPIELPGGETLLLAGDICVADFLRPLRTDAEARNHQRVCKQFFFEECDKYERVFYTPGNHEYYHGYYEDCETILRDFLKGTNVTLLQSQDAVLRPGLRVFGATMWTDLRNDDWFVKKAVDNYMSDFHVIERYPDLAALNGPYGSRKRRMTPLDTVGFHRAAMARLTDALHQHADDQFIVMSHHAPSMESSHPVWGKGENLTNYAYITELSEFILNHKQITHWVHGHVHDSMDYPIGDCRVMCNPRGYAGYQVNETFEPAFTFTV